MVLGTVMLRRLVVGYFIVAEDTSNCILLPQDPNESVAFRMIDRSSRGNILDLGCFPFPIIFDLDCGQEVTPIFMSKATIPPFIILQIILHGRGEYVLNRNSNLMYGEFVLRTFQLSVSKLLPLI